MKVRHVLVGALVIGLLGVETQPAHAVYKKVETYEWFEAGVVANNCTTYPCYAIDVKFGTYEESVPASGVEVTFYWVYDAFNVEVIGSGLTWSDSFLITSANSRKQAQFTGFVDLAEGNCDQVLETCAGPVTTYALSVLVSARTTKARNVKATLVDVPNCNVKVSGTSNFRIGATGTVDLGGVAMTAVPAFVDPTRILSTSKFSSFTRRAVWTKTSKGSPTCTDLAPASETLRYSSLASKPMLSKGKLARLIR